MPPATTTIRLLTWNIQHGGGARRTPWITLALIEARADIIVLTEFRSVRGGQIRAVLADHGLGFQAVSAAADGANAVLVASRWPLEPCSAAGPGRQGRVIEAHVPELDLRVIGAHIPPPPWGGAVGPGRAGGERARAWREALHAARAGRAGRVALLGDFNCGRAGVDGGAFQHTALLGQLATMGYVDAWRRLHPAGRQMTWHGPAGAQGRIDHCFLSAPLAAGLRACWIGDFGAETGFPRDASEGASRLSDHAPVVVEVAIDAGESGAQAVGKTAPAGQKPTKTGS